MPKKRYNAEEIIHRLREADVLLSQGLNVAQVCKKIGIADQTYLFWRRTYVRNHPPKHAPGCEKKLLRADGHLSGRIAVELAKNQPNGGCNGQQKRPGLA